MEAGGFWPKAPGSSTSLEDYAMRNVPSNYVSTSTRNEVAEIFAGRTGYVYGISTDGLPGMSVNDVLGTTCRYAWQQEIAVPGGIPWENVRFYETDGRSNPDGFIPIDVIIRAWKISPDGVPTGEIWENPHYSPK